MTNRSKFSDDVFRATFERYGVVLDEHVNDLRYTLDSNGETELEVIKDDPSFKNLQYGFRGGDSRFSERQVSTRHRRYGL